MEIKLNQWVYIENFKYGRLFAADSKKDEGDHVVETDLASKSGEKYEWMIYQSGSDYFIQNKLYGFMFSTDKDKDKGDHYSECDPNIQTLSQAISKSEDNTKWIWDIQSSSPGLIISNRRYGQMFAADGTKDGGDHIVETRPNSKDIGAKWVWSITDICNTAFPRENWMEALYSIIQNRRLNEIVIPGTHDSGCYRFDSVSIQTQEKSISEQLLFGVRYLDIRFICLPTGYHIHHGLAKSFVTTLTDIVKPIKDFLDKFSKEIVILHITHFEKFNQNDYEKFLSEIRNYLGEFIAKRSHSETLPTIKEMVETNQRVIISSDFKYTKTDTPISDFIQDFVWDDIESPYDEKIYQSGEPDNIINHLSQLVNKNGNQNLWVLQGVMTLSTTQTIAGGVPLVGDAINLVSDVSIKTYAQKINPMLKSYLCSDSWKGKYNIFICDFVNDDLIENTIQLNYNLRNRIVSEP